MALLVGANTASINTGYNDFFGAGDVAGTRAVAVASGSADTMKIVNRSTGSGFTSLTVGVYSDSSGNPGTLLGSTTITATAAGVQSATLSPAVSIVSGTAYWLIASPVGGNFNWSGAVGLAGYKGVSGQTAGSMPSPFPAPTFSETTADGGVPISAESSGSSADATVTAVPADATGGLVVPAVTPAMIAHGAASRSHGTDAGGHTAASAFTWTHTPTGTPKGVVVAITQPLGSTDEVSAVSYGGVALSRVRSTARTTTEAMRVYLYFLGSGIPTGAQTVSVTSTGTTAKQGHCFTVTTTDGSDTSVDADNGSDLGIIANPSLTVTHSGTLNSWVGYGIHGYGGAAVPNLTASAARQANLTLGFGHDPGAATAETYYRTGAAAASSSTYGYTTLASDDQVIAALVVKPVVVSNATVTAVPMAGTGGIASTAVAGNFTAVSPVVDGTGTVPVPAVTATAAITSPVADGTGTIPAPGAAATSGATMAAPPLAGTGAAPAPSLAASSNVVSPAATGTGTIPPLSSILSADLAAPFVVATGTIPPPSVTGSAGGSAVAVPADATGALAAPTVSAGSTVSATAAAGVGDVASPTTATGATVQQSAAVATGTIAPPTVTGGSAGQVSALHAAGAGSFAVPVVSAGATTVAPPADGTGQAPAPSTSGGYTVMPPAAAASGAIPELALSLSSALTVVPMAAIGTLPAPVLAVHGDVSAAPASGRGDALDPAAAADGAVTAVPALGFGSLQPLTATGLVTGLYIGTGRAPAGRLSAAPAGRVLVAPAGTLSP